MPNNNKRKDGLVRVPKALPGVSTKFTQNFVQWLPVQATTVPCTTTSIAQVITFNLSSFPNASNYSTVWEEWTLRELDLQLDSLGTQAGLIKAYIDESDSTTPSANSALRHLGYTVRCDRASGDRVRMKWRAADYSDESFISVNSPGTTKCWLKIYSDYTNFGLAGTAELVGIVTGMVAVQWRTSGGA